MQRRVVVTGLGLVTPLATGVEESWSRILAGESGIGRISKIEVDDLKTQIAGEVLDFEVTDWVDKKLARRTDPFIHYAIAASTMASQMAGLPMPLPPELQPRTGTMVGVGLGGMESLEDTLFTVWKKGPNRVSPFFIPRLIGNMAPGMISMLWKLRGPNTCLATACAAGTHAIGEAFRAISYGSAEIMFCGGAEAVIRPATVAGFGAARAISTRNDEPQRASRPFDADRDGFVMSEGSGMIILEELETAKARGANIICELKGYGLSSDAYHMTAPDPSAEGYVACMNAAISDAGLTPGDIDYINAHGTSTDLNDATESKAIRLLFGEHADKVAVSSTKSMHGHMLGATGGVEAAFCVLTIRDQVMPPTINYETPDPECDLDYVPNVKREAQVDAVLSNSFGFGGTNASVVFVPYRE